MRKLIGQVTVFGAVYIVGFLHGHLTPMPSTALAAVATGPSTAPTDSLMDAFQQAWNAGDLPAMLAQIHPNAFFKSPFQLRYGRDEMASTVLTTNPKVFRNTTNTETHTFASEHVAWSMGTARGDVFDAGEPTGDHLDADYLFVFTPDATV